MVTRSEGRETSEKCKSKGRTRKSAPKNIDPDSYALPGGPPRGLQALLVVGEGRVSEVHVGVDGLLDESLVGVALVLGALEEFANNAAVALSLVAELLDGAVHYALREPDVPLLEAHRVIHNRLVGIPRILSEPLNSPVGLGGHLYLLSRVRRELLATLFLVLQRPARVQPEEVVHGVLVLLQRLGPEVEVCPARVRDGVHPARRPTPRGLPAGLDDALFLHLPERPVQRSRVHRLEPEGRSPLHELVPVRVPLPQGEQDHRYQPVPRPRLNPTELSLLASHIAVLLLIVHDSLFHNLCAFYIYVSVCQGLDSIL